MVCAWLDMRSTCGDYAWTGPEESARLRTMAPILAPQGSWSFPRKSRVFAGHLRAYRGKKSCEPAENKQTGADTVPRVRVSLDWLTSGASRGPRHGS